MKKILQSKRWLYAMAMIVAFSSCKKDVVSPPETPSEPNTVVGTVVDRQGQPIAGAKVSAVNPNGYNIHTDAITDANGKYKIKLTSIGSYKIYAWKEVQYQGKTLQPAFGYEERCRL
jgi:protocatechuate 3,4-dioxygenase beta subunit